MKPRILQNARLSPACEAVLNAEFDVHPLWNEADAAGYLAAHGSQFAGVATTGVVGADAALMDALPNLKVIASRGVGYDTIDVAHAQKKGIRVSNTPEVLNDCVADMGFGAVVAIGRGFAAADRYVRRGDWLKGRYPMTTRVSGKRLGIVGLGAIGRTVAKRASGFDMEIGYANLQPVPEVPYRYEPSVAALAKWADFLIVTVTGGPGTRHLISREVLDALGPAGFLVNISRGTVVDQAALIEALQQKRIAGAALDVYESEPNVPEALLALDNVMVTPHMASGTRETFKAMEDLVLDNLRHYFRSGGLLTPVV